MQKTANLSEWEVPFCDYKSPKTIVTVRSNLLGRCQLPDILQVFMLLLHNHCLEGITGDDVITYISTEFEL